MHTDNGEGLRIVFMGTADFGIPAMTALHQRFGLRAVVTLPDAHVGRGRSLQPTPVKRAAMDLGISTVLQPASLKDEDFLAALRDLEPDIICVIAFRIIPRAVYSLAKLGAFNVHGSLLPRYRGAAPVHHAIINGERRSGVTSFLLNDVVDTGSILLDASYDIPDGTTAGELYAALMPLAADVAVDTVRLLADGNVHATQQDESLASAAPKVWREHSAIAWDRPSEHVRQFILGLSPQPCAWTLMDGERIKVYRATCVRSASLERSDAGEWSIGEEGWMVRCGDGMLRLDEVQMPGKPPMRTDDFLRGWRGARQGRFSQTATDH